MRALLIVPLMGPDSKNFLRVADHLRTHVYKKDAMIFKTQVQKLPISGHFSGTGFLRASDPPKKGGSNDFFESLKEAETFICIAHNGETDGPVLTDEYDDWLERQPWHTNGTGVQLWLGGVLFWQLIGRAPNTQKILLLGCNSAKSYAKCVNDVANIPVFGFKDSCAAADSATMFKHVSSIENTGKSHGMARIPAH